MKPVRKRMRLAGWDYSGEGTYFLTLCAKDRKPMFSRIVGRGILDAPEVQLSGYGRLIRDSLLFLMEKHPEMKLHRWVIMPNHVHILLTIEKRSVPVCGASGMPRPTEGEGTTDGASGMPRPTESEGTAGGASGMPRPTEGEGTTDGASGMPRPTEGEGTADGASGMPRPTGEKGIADGASGMPRPTEGEGTTDGASGMPRPTESEGTAGGASGMPRPTEGEGTADGASGMPRPTEEKGIAGGASGMPRPTDAAIPKLISSLKRFTNRKSSTELWQNGYYDHIVRDEQDFLRRWKYIENNPAAWLEDDYYVD